ncbi:MAG: hypothetical protein AB1Y25_02815 [Cycloclasticus sp.]
MVKLLGTIYRKKTNQESEILTFGKSEEVFEKDIIDGISRFGGTMRQPNYSYAYLKSARVLLDNASVNKQLDEFGLPVFYMVRHTLELKIKDLLSLAYDILQMNHELYNNEDTKVNLPSNGQLDRLRKNHIISSLYNDLLHSCEKLEVKVPELLFSSVIKVLNHYEVNPTWSRYNKSNKGSHVADEVTLPIVKLVEDLEMIFVAVSYDSDNFKETMESELYSEFNSLMSRIEDTKC